MLRKRSCMIRQCRWLDQQQRKPQWVSFMPETQKKNRLRQNRPDSRKNRYPLPVPPSVYRSCPILSTGIFPQTCFGSTPINTASEAKIPPMRCFIGVFKTDQQTQIQTIGFRKLNKLVFVAVRPKLSVIANQCAHWCGNPPVSEEMYRIAPKKWESPRFLAVIVPGSMGPGDCHDQCAHWSRNDRKFGVSAINTNLLCSL